MSPDFVILANFGEETCEDVLHELDCGYSKAAEHDYEEDGDEEN